MGRPKDDAFRRDKGAPFDHLEKEEYAKARAKGGTMKAAAGLVGISNTTAAAWERHPEIRERMRELRVGAEDFVGVSKAWIINQLKENAEIARDEGQLKSSNEALGMLYKILLEDPEVGHLTARSLPPSVTPAELQARLRESFAKQHALTESIDTSAEEVPREA